MSEFNKQDFKSLAERLGFINAVYHRVEVTRVDTPTTLGGFQIGLRIANPSETNTLMVDLGGVDFISARGIEVLLTLQGRYRKNDGKIVLLDAPDSLKSILEVAGLSEHLPQISSKV